MKTKFSILLFFFIFLFSQQSLIAQPFELDPKIKPIALELMDDANNEGAKGIIAPGEISDSPAYYFVKGHDIFQYIDVYVFSNYGNPKFSVELVKDTWGDVSEKQTSTAKKNGIINFKLRTWGDFGFKIIPEDGKVNFSIIVYASAPVKNYLDSPFIKATEQNTGVKLDQTSNINADASSSPSDKDKTEDSSSNIWMFIIIGVLLVVVGALVGKILSRKNASLFLLIICFFSGIESYAQMHDGGTWAPHNVDQYKEWLEREADNNRDNSLGDVKDGIGRLGEIGSNLGNVLDTYKKTQELESSYQGLGDCVNSVSPPGAPKLPSFCEGADSDCGGCFLDAREKFNYARYQFEKLSAIYNCTKEFSDKAIAFGDNVSGYHGISGMAWQIQRVNIEKSVKELQKAFDKKFVELLKDLHDSLMMLNECEAEHGLPDWYDRFGYMYYEFIKINYRRTS